MRVLVTTGKKTRRQYRLSVCCFCEGIFRNSGKKKHFWPKFPVIIMILVGGEGREGCNEPKSRLGGGTLLHFFFFLEGVVLAPEKNNTTSVEFFRVFF